MTDKDILSKDINQDCQKERDKYLGTRDFFIVKKISFHFC